ncbi:hypothetical protein SAMN05192549_101364 [Duganella sacchari]|uniref:Uncharacterized protein n=1 Tax=Duganella sacchari TaxID=551987 RepID=A0A1M7I248_9BURK|nr:hypothetical protein SAMN05192549_101364 [Duganella sacchari]
MCARFVAVNRPHRRKGFHLARVGRLASDNRLLMLNNLQQISSNKIRYKELVFNIAEIS